MQQKDGFEINLGQQGRMSVVYLRSGGFYFDCRFAGGGVAFELPAEQASALVSNLAMAISTPAQVGQPKQPVNPPQAKPEEFTARPVVKKPRPPALKAEAEPLPAEDSGSIM